MSDTIETPALADTTAIEYSPTRLRAEAHLMLHDLGYLALKEPPQTDPAPATFAQSDEALARWIVEKAEEAYQQGISDTVDLLGKGRRVNVYNDSAGTVTEAIMLDRAGVTP